MRDKITAHAHPSREMLYSNTNENTYQWDHTKLIMLDTIKIQAVRLF